MAIPILATQVVLAMPKRERDERSWDETWLERSQAPGDTLELGDFRSDRWYCPLCHMWIQQNHLNSKKLCYSDDLVGSKCRKESNTNDLIEIHKLEMYRRVSAIAPTKSHAKKTDHARALAWLVMMETATIIGLTCQQLRLNRSRCGNNVAVTLINV